LWMAHNPGEAAARTLAIYMTHTQVQRQSPGRDRSVAREYL
jgi:hypothetical protein